MPDVTGADLGRVAGHDSQACEFMTVVPASSVLPNAPAGSPAEQLKRFEGIVSPSQGHNLAVTVLHVPYSLERGGLAFDMARCGTSWGLPPS